MTGMEIVALVELFLGLLMKYGIPATLKIIEVWNVEDPTTQDIDDLKSILPPVEHYFANASDVVAYKNDLDTLSANS